MYYFASDMHLTGGLSSESRARERLLVEWLERVSVDAKAIFLVGDVFDFWFEYKRVVPKGFTRLLGKLSELTDKGISIHFFTGNHDMWQRDYLEKECGVKVHFEREVFELYGKNVSVVHGDQIYASYLGGWTRVMDCLFRSRTARWFFTRIHPDAAMRFGQSWSHGSRKAKEVAMLFLGAEDPLVKEAVRLSRTENTDYYVFGHNHCAEDVYLPDGRRVIFLGQWFFNPVYAVLSPDGEIALKHVEEQ